MSKEKKEQFIERSGPPKKDTCGTCIFYQNERAKSHGVGSVHVSWYWGGCCWVEPGDGIETKRDRIKCRFYEDSK